MLRTFVTAGALFAVAGVSQAADAVTIWNQKTLAVIRKTSTVPPRAARVLAMVHVAMYDAVNARTLAFKPYLASEKVEPSYPVDALATAAAYRVLATLYPAEKDALRGEYDRLLSAVAPSLEKEAAVALGDWIGLRVLRSRQDDGSNVERLHFTTAAPGKWRPTWPGHKPALLPAWGDVRPFAIRSPDDFQTKPPPLLSSEEYARDFNEVRRLGGEQATDRTPEQTTIARFWEDGPGTVTPPGHWNVIARTVAEARGLSIDENARLFALLNVALADSAIVCWRLKFRDNFWRPVTAINEADRDQNPNTARDAAWTPLLDTPPFPSCTSGHSTFSGAAAEVLAFFFGSDEVPFATTSERLEGVRKFARFSEAAEEAGKSRVYGGIHFDFDNRAGLESGKAVARYVTAKFMTPVAPAPNPPIPSADNARPGQ